MFKKIWGKIKSLIAKWQEDRAYEKAAKDAGWYPKDYPIRQPKKEERAFWFTPSKTPNTKSNGKNNSRETFY